MSEIRRRAVRRLRFDCPNVGLFLLWGAIPFLAEPVSAQDVRATLVGRVVDLTASTVVAGADVRLLDTERQTTTDDSGSFEFRDLVPGEYVVEVRQPGYELHVDQINLEAGETLEVRFTIGVDAIPLEPITVVARSQSVAERATVEGRRFDGMDRPQIEAVLGRVSTMSGLIREARTPGVSVVDFPQAVCLEHGRVTRRRRDAEGNGFCRPMAVYLDGVRQMLPGEVLKDIDPESVERFEILSPLQATVLYGQDAESGVIVIETQRGGRRMGAPLVVYSHDRPRWAFSLGATGSNPSFTHNGVVLLTFAGGNLSSLYEEKSAWRAGLRGSVSARVYGYHRLGLTAYGLTGNSTGRYSSIRLGGFPTVQERGHTSLGLDLTYQPRLRASERYDLRFEFGPTWSWQRIQLSNGHNDEWADPIGATRPTVAWQDRTWYSLGVMIGMQLNGFVTEHWSWFAGARIRALYYGDSESWERQNIEDIVAQTGNIVFLDYSQPLALHPTFSVGLTWRGSDPSFP